MRTSTYRNNPPVFVSRIILACLFILSVSLLAHPCRGQTQQPSAPAAPPAVTPPATPAVTPSVTPSVTPAVTPPATPAVTSSVAKPVKYDELPCIEAREKERTAINKLLKIPTPSAADSAALQTYLEEYGLARWTVKAHEHEVRKFRLDLRTDFRRIRSRQTYDQTNDLALRMLGDITKGNYSPVARVNAMLAIGDLIVQEPAKTSIKAVPLAQALPLMLEAYSSPDQIDGVRFAALLGILKHASLGIADDSQVLSVMLATVKASQPPAGRSAAGHEFFRLRAMETLGARAKTGQQGEVANAMGDVVSDEESSLLVRCVAARCLGQLDYSDPAGMAPGNFIAKLTQLATAICTQEVAALDKLKRDELIAGKKIQGPSASGGMYGSGSGEMDMYEGEMSDESGGGDEMDMYEDMMGGVGGGMIMKEEEEDTMETRRIKGSRRRLKSRMDFVMTGLGMNGKRDDGSRVGIHVLATDPNQETLLNDLTAAITKLLDALDDKEELDSDKLDEAIATASDEIGLVLVSTATGTEEEQPPAEDTTAAAPVTP